MGFLLSFLAESPESTPICPPDGFYAVLRLPKLLYMRGCLAPIYPYPKEVPALAPKSPPPVEGYAIEVAAPNKEPLDTRFPSGPFYPVACVVEGWMLVGAAFANDGNVAPPLLPNRLPVP